VPKRENNILTIRFFIVVASLIVGAARADMMGNYPRAWVATSINNNYSFTMLPGTGDREPHGFAVKHLDDGSSSMHWSTSGWYGFNGYLTSDGVNLVAHADNQILVDRPDIVNIEVIRFQVKDKLLKAYTPGDLVRDVGALRRSASHIYWIAQVQKSHLYGLKGNEFTLVTAEKNRFVFDIRSGNITNIERADDIKTYQEIEKEKHRLH